MTGYHQVKEFKFANGLGHGVALPEGWKPFAAYPLPYGGVRLVCRKWVRHENADQA